MPKKLTKEDFIKKAKEKHGDKYDYSKAEYVNNRTKVCIICPKHGEFEQMPASHIRGCGCPKCANESMAERLRSSKEDFIKKSREKHGDKYDYTNVEYKDYQTNVCIVCPEHGEFWQVPSYHIRGSSCPKCANYKQKLSKEEFIKKANKKHGDKYNYDKVSYVNNATKVCIICPEHDHGEFWQVPYSHLNGNGCPKCSGCYVPTTEEWIVSARKVHGDKYDYSKVDYKNERTKVCIICHEHGEFLQTPKNHLIGQGCPTCGKRYAREYKQNNYQSFMNESIKRFGEIYEFPNIQSEYINSHSKITIKCKKCGSTFIKIACDHITSSFGGCACYSFKSKGEDEIQNYIKACINEEEIKLNDRSVLNGKELDIYIPSRKLAIEYNGVYYHSETYGRKDKYYHLDKTLECEKNGIRLIHIFEDEYVYNKEIVLSKLRHILNINDSVDKIYGRKCKINEIDNKLCKEFLEKNHIQGFSPSTVYIGSFHKDKLIGVMSFKKTKNEWELTRFATDINSICCGVGGKIFKYFVKKYNPYKIKSFSDRRWSIDSPSNLYRKLGFILEKYTLPDYRYIKPNIVKRYHKFGFRKKTLYNKYGLPLSMTESEMVKELGYDRIWDCGLIKYVWYNNKT